MILYAVIYAVYNRIVCDLSNHSICGDLSDL